MLAKVLSTKQEALDFDMQLMAMEMDTSANYLRYIAKADLEDAILIDCFDLMVKDIEQDAAEIESFNDNTIMYEFNGEPIVIHTCLSEKYLIFDSMNTTKFESLLRSYKE